MINGKDGNGFRKRLHRIYTPLTPYFINQKPLGFNGLLFILKRNAHPVFKCVLFWMSFLWFGNLQAQVPSAFKTKTFRVLPDTLVLDSLSIVPGSVTYIRFPIREKTFAPKLDYRLHALVFLSTPPDSITVRYQTFPYNFEKKYFHKNPSQVYQDVSVYQKPYTIFYNTTDDKRNEFLFQNDGLNKNGSISRGINFGNNQDVSVNSNLNLQVNGKLAPDIDMVLAATDNNIPFQADGTTAQLQEFDKVFIQLNNASTKLLVGDYQLSRPDNSYFMNFYKRTQGLLLENNYTDSSLKQPLKFRTSISGAVSRGKFSRQVFFGIENNQGPYRLRGADNEPFIVILSGTEKIYIDGKLLQRGQENDYIIDYNTAELIFTAKQLITKDKRIVAEFQYAERNYARSLLFFGEEVSTQKMKAFVNVFSEQDNKNRPLQQTLTQAQKNVLIAIGDTLEKAVSSGVEEASFNNSDVFYERKDSVVNNLLYSPVYVYSINPDKAKFRLKFSNVGASRGNYIQVNGATANGKIFRWVAPINGIKQGLYEPVITLVTPKRSQMVTAGVQYSFNPQHSLQTEGVYTKNDLNTFSPADARNDEAGGFKLVSKNETTWPTDSAGRTTKLIYNANYEYVQKQFSQIERFRSVEFERDWNRPLNASLANDQHIASIETGITHKTNSRVFYQIAGFKEATNYEGLKQQLNAAQQFKRFQSQYNGSFLQSRDTSKNTQFYRHKILLTQTINRFRLSWSDELENNLFKKDNRIQNAAYQFWEWEGAISNADTSRNRYKVFYRERRDKQGFNGQLTDSTMATNIGLQSQINSIKNNPFSVLVTYRKLNTKNLRSTAIRPDNSLLGRVEYNPRYWNGFITANAFYETGYGLENRREFYYIEVVASQGTYAWNDYNNNGIKELNEFEIAQFQDQARYIRIYVPTNTYVKVLQNQLSVAFNLKPSVLLSSKKNKIAAFVSRFATQTSFRIDNRTADNGELYSFNPFLNVQDTLLIANTNNIRQSLFFNQSSAIFSMDYTYLNNSSKQLLANGIEGRNLSSHQVKGRITFLKNFIFQNDNTLGTKLLETQFFNTRNFDILFFDTEQQLSYQPNTLFRISSSFKYSQKTNLNKGVANEQSVANNFGLEIRWNSSEKGNVSARVDYIKITYKGETNSPVAYEMLNALLPGNNYTWNLGFQRNLTSNIQISINYDGRKSEGGKIIHIGGAQVRAFF